MLIMNYVVNFAKVFLHARLDADTVGVLDVFGRDDKTCHSDWI